MACVNDPVALLPHVAEGVARAGDPSRVAALDTVGTHRPHMLKLSRHDLFRIHARADVAPGRRLDPIL